MEAVATVELLTVPELAGRLEVPPGQLDGLRLKVRRHEVELLASGLMVRAGGRRLLRGDRLEEIRAMLNGK